MFSKNTLKTLWEQLLPLLQGTKLYLGRLINGNL